MRLNCTRQPTDGLHMGCLVRRLYAWLAFQSSLLGQVHACITFVQSAAVITHQPINAPIGLTWLKLLVLVLRYTGQGPIGLQLFG